MGNVCERVGVTVLDMHVLVYAVGTNACVSVHAYACACTPVCVWTYACARGMQM